MPAPFVTWPAWRKSLIKRVISCGWIISTRPSRIPTKPWWLKARSTSEILATEKYITKDFLPVYLSTANEDFIHDQTIKFADFLEAKGVEYVCKSFGDEKHPEPHVFLMNQRDELAKQCNEEEVAFFKAHLVN